MVLPIGGSATVVAETSQSVVVLHQLRWPSHTDDSVQLVQAPSIQLVVTDGPRLMLVKSEEGYGIVRPVTRLPQAELGLSAREHWELIRPVENQRGFPGPDTKLIAELKAKMVAAAELLGRAYGVEIVVESPEYNSGLNRYTVNAKVMGITQQSDAAVWATHDEIPTLDNLRPDAQTLQGFLSNNSASLSSIDR